MTERREFLKYLAAATASVVIPAISHSSPLAGDRDRLGKTLPKRKLGKTRAEVTMLGLGGYHIGWTTEKDAQETIEAALEGGIRFFDNAESYGPGTSEIRYGKYLTPKYRDIIFLMTKTQAKTADGARKHLEESLKRLNTDYLDLWQVHSLFAPEDVDERVKNGVLDVMREAKASGKVKHIGFTGHQNPASHMKMLEYVKDDDIFETCQMPINVVDPGKNSFIKQVMPVLQKRNYGILAMKTLADGRFFASKEQGNWKTDNPIVPNKISIKDALYFAWSLPISVLITGAEKVEYVKDKIELAKGFIKLSDQERENLVARVAEFAPDGKVEYYKNI